MNLHIDDYLSIVTVEPLFATRTISTTANGVTLLCNMRDYIRPDDQFQWFRDSAPALNDRYSMLYVNGSLQAQNGLATLSPTRWTGLAISNPEVSDTGTYTCAVNGTSSFAAVELIVIDPSK